MKKFKFSLEGVLKLRKLAVDRELKNLSIIVGNLNKLQNEINDNNRIIRTSTDRFDTLGTDIKHIRLFEGYMKSLFIQNENLQKSIANQEGVLNEARKKVQEVEKDAKIIEILKEKAVEEYKDKHRKLVRKEEEEKSIQEYTRAKLEFRTDEEESEVSRTKVREKIERDESRPVRSKVQSDYDKIMDFAESLKPKH